MTDTTPKPAPPPKGCELLRENIFEDTKASVLEDDDELLKRREPTMLRKGNLLVPATRGEKKYTVVFDLDETVVYARDGPLYARAYLRELLRAIKNDFEVIVWTAGERDYAKNVLEEINEDHIIQHLIYRDSNWFDEEDYTKDLKRLARDLDHTIIIENTPDCVRDNPQNGIIVEDFEVLQPSESERDEECLTPPPAPATAPTAQLASTAFPSTPLPTDGVGSQTEHSAATVVGTPSSSQRPKRQHTDRTLYLLREVLLDLAHSGETVPVFLTRCELLSQQVVTGSDGSGISIYHLGTRRRRKDAGTPRKVIKANRDKTGPPPAPPTVECQSSSPPTTTPAPENAGPSVTAQTTKRPRTPSSTPPPPPPTPPTVRRKLEKEPE